MTEQVFQRANLRTIGDLQDYPGDLRDLVGSFGPALKRFAYGEHDRPLDTTEGIKRISSEETFLEDTEDRQVLRTCLRTQAADICRPAQRKTVGRPYHAG